VFHKTKRRPIGRLLFYFVAATRQDGLITFADPDGSRLPYFMKNESTMSSAKNDPAKTPMRFKSRLT
jgi:hypothetical protein